jgi:hypothetical protein
MMLLDDFALMRVFDVRVDVEKDEECEARKYCGCGRGEERATDDREESKNDHGHPFLENDA